MRKIAFWGFIALNIFFVVHANIAQADTFDDTLASPCVNNFEPDGHWCGDTGQLYRNQQSFKLRTSKLRSRVDNGVAGATAIAGLPFGSTAGKTSVAGSVGAAKAKASLAFGVQHNFQNNWKARAVGAFGDKYMQGSIGAGYEF